jgi:hypothetical protein
MEREFVPYEASLRMKAIGFDEFCFAFYQIEYTESMPTMVDDNEEYRLTGFRTCKNSEIPEHYVSAPIFSQVFRWFREKNFYVSINTYHSVNEDKPFGLSIDYLHESGKWDYLDYRGESDFETYEEAELAGLTKLIEIVETRTK